MHERCGLSDVGRMSGNKLTSAWKDVHPRNLGEVMVWRFILSVDVPLKLIGGEVRIRICFEIATIAVTANKGLIMRNAII